VEIYVFSCRHRVPEAWLPPLSPEEVNGHRVRLIRLPCSAKLGTVQLLRPFEAGVDGVLVMACPEKGCRSLDGSSRAKKRVREANGVLDEIGLGSTRVLMKQTADGREETFVQAIEELAASAEELGPNPVKGN
jgi:F420-non-reducing hydrogenase iron-sulfur subunit